MGRREIIKTILKYHNVINDRKSDLLDIGCGTGINLKVFQEHMHSFGCDLSDDAIYYCQKRNLRRVVKSHAAELPFKDQKFCLVTLLDVLYHRNVQSDAQVLREAHRVLKNHGYLMITDSAFNFLMSQHDLAAHARERYTKRKLIKKLNENGFLILKLSYFNFFLFPVVLSVRIFERLTWIKNKKPGSNLKPVNDMLNRILIYILRIEASLIRNLNFPFGSSLLCLAKKIPQKNRSLP